MIGLDSDCIIDFLRAKQNAIDIISANKGLIITTEINKFEVLFGIYKRKDMCEEEKILADKLFSNITVLPFDEGCAKIAAQQLGNLSKEGNIIDSHDMFVGAILLKNECPKIITRNIKDYSRIDGIEVISY